MITVRPDGGTARAELAVAPRELARCKPIPVGTQFDDADREEK
jgi:hypothetical protein